MANSEDEDAMSETPKKTKRSKKTETPEKALTLKDIAEALDKDTMKPAEAKRRIAEISLTSAYYAYDNPNKMIYDGDKDNSLYMIDKLAGDRHISMEAWRRIHNAVHTGK